MRRRPSVERMIKRLKCDLGDGRLSKRGNERTPLGYANFPAGLEDLLDQVENLRVLDSLGDLL